MKFSIIVLYKNRKRLSEICLESILANTNFSDGELIGIDAGSEDNITQYFVNKPFDTFISLPKERGVYDITRSPSYFNKGLDIAKGEYIIKMDGDIFVREGWLDPLINILTSPTIGVSSYFFCGDGSLESIISHELSGEQKIYLNQIYTSSNIINGGIWVMKREFLNSIGGYNVDREWGGALDSGMSKKFLNTGKELAYLYPTHAKHCGGVINTKKSLQNGSIITDEQFDNIIKEHYIEEWNWYINRKERF